MRWIGVGGSVRTKSLTVETLGAGNVVIFERSTRVSAEVVDSGGVPPGEGGVPNAEALARTSTVQNEIGMATV
jgi:hypothetical protein